jgi:uncharacterized protein YhfF
LQLGYAGTPLRQELVDAVLRGEKTSTSSLRAHYEPHSDESLPKEGERLLLLDSEDRPVAIVEVTEVRIVRVADVDLAFARDEGRASRRSRSGASRTSVSGPATASRMTRSSSPSASG